MTAMVRLDVWGGVDSMDHVARYHHPLDGDEWRTQSEREMRAGFLVNLRRLGPGEGWGENKDFDERRAPQLGRA